MNLSISENEMAEYVSRQCQYFFPDGVDADVGGVLRPSLDLALNRTEYCFSRIKLRGYGEGREAKFNHLHSDQYSQFLYYLANSIWRLQPEYEDVCRKIILLNRTLNACWFSYKGNLPKVFLLVHPMGTVLGNASYGEYAVFLQNVTVNTQVDKHMKPAGHIGDFLYMSAGSKIIGNEPIGNDVTLGVDTTVYNRYVEDNTLLFRNSEGVVEERHNHISPARRYFYTD